VRPKNLRPNNIVQRQRMPLPDNKSATLTEGRGATLPLRKLLKRCKGLKVAPAACCNLCTFRKQTLICRFVHIRLHSNLWVEGENRVFQLISLFPRGLFRACFDASICTREPLYYNYGTKWSHSNLRKFFYYFATPVDYPFERPPSASIGCYSFPTQVLNLGRLGYRNQ
jgi:hypothetical protein